MKMFTCMIFAGLLLLSLSACSFPEKHPESGIYYCNELNISIDFSKDAYKRAKLHNKDNKTTDLVCYFDYGDGIEIFEADFSVEDGEEICSPIKYYILGNFKWRSEEIWVENGADNITYVFEKQEEEALSNE